MAGRAQTAVVIESRYGELAFGGLDAAPLEREAVGTKAHVGHELYVLAPAVERVTRVAAGWSVPDKGSCSQAHQSLLTLPPSI